MATVFKVGRIVRAWANTTSINAWYVEVDVGDGKIIRDILYSKNHAYHAKIIGNYVLVNCNINPHYPYHNSIEITAHAKPVTESAKLTRSAALFAGPVTGKVLTTYRQHIDDFECTPVPKGKYIGDDVTIDDILSI